MFIILPLLLIQILAVISPGPDLAMIIQQSLLHGRKSSWYSAIWLWSGILIHSSYCIIGIVGLLHLYPSLISIIQIAGACYLLYLWYSGRTSTVPSVINDSISLWTDIFSNRQSYKVGLLTNILNPKVTLFILTLYSSAELSLQQQIILAIAMATSTTIWFIIVGTILTIPRIQALFIRIIPVLTNILSVLLLWLWIWILIQQIL